MWSNRISMEKDERGRPRGGAEIARWLVSDLERWFGDEDGYLIIVLEYNSNTFRLL